MTETEPNTETPSHATGDLPDVWQTRTLGDLTDNFDSVRVPIKEAERKKGAYPYYGASGIVDHVDGYLFDGKHLLVAEDGENLRTRQTPIAFCANGRFWVNNHAHIVKGNDEADTTFLMYALQQKDVSGYLTGSTMPKLTQGNLNRLLIVAPPLAEQRAIAHVLGAFDDKIELNRRMNETLETLARAVFESWFVRFDPVRAKERGEPPAGMDADTAALFPSAFVDSTLGAIPEGWTVKPIEDCARIVGGGTPSTSESAFWDDGTIHWVTPKDLSPLVSPVLLDTERKITPEGLRRVSSGLLPVGTLLMSSRAPIGYLAISEVPVAINQGFIAMICDKGIPNYFLLNWARHSQDTIIGRANGSTFLEISKSSFRPLPVVVPTDEMLSRFTETVAPMYEKIVANLLESRTLAALRDALLPKLVSGAVRLPTNMVARFADEM